VVSNFILIANKNEPKCHKLVNLDLVNYIFHDKCVLFQTTIKYVIRIKFSSAEMLDIDFSNEDEMLEQFKLLAEKCGINMEHKS